MQAKKTAKKPAFKTALKTARQAWQAMKKATETAIGPYRGL